MDILTLNRKGLTQRGIARKLSISRTTVQKYLEYPDLAFARPAGRKRKSQFDAYAENIEAWISEDPFYTATWIYGRLRAMGFAGNYEIVKRRGSKIKNRRQAVAYMRFETEPGYQAQVDFGEFRIVQGE